MADGMDAIADAIEAGDQGQIDAAVAGLGETLTTLSEEAGPVFEQLLAACPELEEIMA